LWLTWLARFWEQQLLEGRAWTTAGRLIPMARAVGGVAASAAFTIAWSDPLGRAPGTSDVALGGGLAVLFLTTVMVLCYRDVLRSHRSSELIAGLALIAAAKVAAVLLFLFVGRESGVLSILAAAATVIALANVALREGVALPVSTAIVAGLFPAMIVFRLAQPFEPLRLAAPVAVALAAIIVLWMLRPRIRHSAADI
jgi:hypothetical protein